MKSKSPESRKSHRFLAGVEATVICDSKPFSCQAIDLHRQGALVEGEFDLADQVRVTIRLESTTGDLKLEASGEAAHLSKNPETGQTRLGIRFDALPEDQKTTLESLLSRVIEGTHPAPIARLERGASEAEIRDALGKVPLAHKITYAQRAVPHERGFLMHDDNARVLEAICRNPQLTRPEVVEILGKVTLLPTTLELLARDPRWKPDEELQIFIATHPRVTYPVVEQIVERLGPNAIRKLVRNPGLNPAIKNKLVQTIPNKQFKGW